MMDFWNLNLTTGFSGVAGLIFWAALAVPLYVYIGYPIVLAVISVFTPKKQPEPGYTPFLSVLICAYNEEKNIGQKISQTLKLDYPADKMEVLVLSDCSTDSTDAIVRECQDPRVRLLRMEQRRGKTSAQNQGVLHARGEVLVFSDATTVYHPLALRYLACNYQDPSVGAVSGRYQYFDPQSNSPTGMGTIAFWNYENFIKKLQSRIQTISGCCGCIYSVRKQAYTPLPEDIISDLVQPLQVIRKGYRVMFEDRALAYEETTQSTTEEFAMRVRVVTRAIRGVLSVRDLLNPLRYGWVAFQLWSHKVLRWLIPLFLILLFASNAMLANRPVWNWLFVLQLVFYLLVAVAAVRPLSKYWKPLGLPLYFCTLNAAALVSLVQVFRGRKYVVWQTVRQR